MQSFLSNRSIEFQSLNHSFGGFILIFCCKFSRMGGDRGFNDMGGRGGGGGRYGGGSMGAR